jgi:hypothetical protein
MIIGAVLVSVLSIGLWETFRGGEARAATLGNEGASRDKVVAAQEKTNQALAQTNLALKTTNTNLQKISAKLDTLIALFKGGKAMVKVTTTTARPPSGSGSRTNVKK